MQRFNADAILRVSVLQSGTILADGREVPLDGLDARLAEVKSLNGAVWYYREDGTSEAPPSAAEVIKLVVKHSLPISMSSKPDFSDTVDENGVSRPREG